MLDPPPALPLFIFIFVFVFVIIVIVLCHPQSLLPAWLRLSSRRRPRVTSIRSVDSPERSQDTLRLLLLESAELVRGPIRLQE